MLLRTGFAAVILVAIWRPHVPRTAAGRCGTPSCFGLVLAGMNLSFYAALDRIPLGIAVTFEFTGPFAVAVAASRRASDLLWVALAAGGIVLLSPRRPRVARRPGVAFALLAGAFWAAYIVLAARVGRAYSGGEGLAVAMAVATVVLIPAAWPAARRRRPRPARRRPRRRRAQLAIPYSLELEALRRLQKGTFGVLMSLEPAVAALVGLVLLGQGLSVTEVVAIALVVAASAGALCSARAPAPVEA